MCTLYNTVHIMQSFSGDDLFHKVINRKEQIGNRTHRNSEELQEKIFFASTNCHNSEASPQHTCQCLKITNDLPQNLKQPKDDKFHGA